MRPDPLPRKLARRALVAALAPLAAAAALAQERVVLHADLPSTGGTLLSLVEATGTAALPVGKLRGLDLLPIDVHGRTQLDALLPGRPRFLDDVPGASRIGLPGVGGFLYRHARELPDGTPVFGFLRVAPDGSYRLLFERPGTGPAGDGDPWLSRVAIAADGRRVLAATKPAAGGDVLELDLVDESERVRTSNLPPVPWIEGGLAFGADFGVAVSTRGVFRFDLTPGAVAQRVPMGQPAPSWYSGGVAFSPNGAFAITTAGSGPQQADVYVFSKAGAARKTTQQPGELSGAGFLPDALDGPFLAVSDDGAMAAWRADVLDPVQMKTTREAFVGRVEPAPGEVPAQVTGDAFFIDTLDEVGVLISAQVGKMVLAVGARSLDPGEFPLENADFFQVTLDPNGAPQFVNITRTSGDLAAPFETPGALVPSRMHELPEAGGLLVWTEESGGTGRLILVRPDQVGFQTILPDVKELDFAVRVGGELALSVQRRLTSTDPHQVLRAPLDLSSPPQVLVEVPLDTRYLYPVTAPGGWLAFLARDDLGVEQVQRLQVSGGGLESFPAGGGAYGDVLGLSPGGALLLSRETVAGEALFFRWAFDGSAPVQLRAPLAPGHFLPGE